MVICRNRPARRSSLRSRRIAAERGQQQQRFGVHRTRQRADQLRSGVVRPLEIVQKDRRGAAFGDGRQGLADGLEERRAIASWGWWTELWQQQGQVRGKRSGGDWHLARGPEVGPQCLDNRAERRCATLNSQALQNAEARVGQRVMGQCGLADAGLASEQHHRALASGSLIHPGVQLLLLELSAD